MKKILMLSLMLASQIVSAQMPGLKDFAEKAKSAASKKAGEIATNCKDENLRFCKENEIDLLKACLVENRDNLTPNCRATLGL